MCCSLPVVTGAHAYYGVVQSVLPLIVNDVRYAALASLKDKKDAFREYVNKLGNKANSAAQTDRATSSTVCLCCAADESFGLTFNMCAALSEAIHGGV